MRTSLETIDVVPAFFRVQLTDSPGCWSFKSTTSLLPRPLSSRLLTSLCMSRTEVLILDLYHWISLTSNFSFSIRPIQDFCQNCSGLLLQNVSFLSPFSLTVWRLSLFSPFMHTGISQLNFLYFHSHLGVLVSASRMNWTEARDCSEDCGFKVVKKDKTLISQDIRSCWFLIEHQCI